MYVRTRGAGRGALPAGVRAAHGARGHGVRALLHHLLHPRAAVVRRDVLVLLVRAAVQVRLGGHFCAVRAVHTR